MTPRQTSRTSSQAAIGFTVKSGWACAVLLTGSAASPSVADSRRIELSDPAIPDARQPYHAGFGTARGAGRELRTLVRSVERYGRQSVIGFIDQHLRAGQRLRGAGVIVGSLIEPERIANDHIRIHALEGQLFRGVITNAAAERKLPCAIWRERDVYGVAAVNLESPESALRSTLAALGRGVPGGWRAEHKAAALAAWLVMAGHGGG